MTDTAAIQCARNYRASKEVNAAGATGMHDGKRAQAIREPWEDGLLDDMLTAEDEAWGRAEMERRGAMRTHGDRDLTVALAGGKVSNG